MSRLPVTQLGILFGMLSLPVGNGAAAQHTAPGSLYGSVLDGDSNSALALARVALVVGGRGILPPESPERDVLAGARIRLTDEAGAYHFDNVVPGHYRLFVRRIGYRPTVVDLYLEGPQALQLSIGLSVAPIRLAPVTATEAPVDKFSEPSSTDSLTWDRLSRERWRQETFAATDVRMVAQPDVEEAITLGERDLLRALRRFPGVSGRDDWTAEPWVRGAPAGHTRVYFDEIPLFSPHHAGGLSTSIDADALGAAFFYPGARPLGTTEGAAAVVDLRSRAAGREATSGRLSVSGSKIGASLAKRWMEGRIGTIVTGSRSWLQSTRTLARTADGLTPDIPNDFADIVARTDVVLSDNTRLEVSGLWQRDWINGFLDGGPANNRASWGSTLARATLQFPLGRGTFRQTIGVSNFTSSIRQIESRLPLAAYDSLPTQEPTDNNLLYATVRGEWVDRDAETAGVRWRLGYEFGHYRVAYRGAPPTPHSVLTYLYTLEVDDVVSLNRAWVERWWYAGENWVIRAGVRGEKFSGDSETYIEPFAAVRHDISDRLRVSLATARFVQYVQPLAPSGLLFGPALSSGPVWVLAPTVGRPLVSDVTSLGAEYWLHDDWLGSVHLYARETDGIAIPDPRPGPTDDDQLLVHAHDDSWGTEWSVRKLAGSWTGSLAYTWGFANYTAHGNDWPSIHFPSPTDRRHVLDIAASTRLTRSVGGGTVHVGGAFTAASGAPYTRIHPGWYDCSAYQPGGGCNPIVPNTVEDPNAERAPWTTGANLRLEWTRTFQGWRLGAHAQMQNVLNASRPSTYAVDETSCRRRSLDQAFCSATQDTFLPGLRRHVELGVRLGF